MKEPTAFAKSPTLSELEIFVESLALQEEYTLREAAQLLHAGTSKEVLQFVQITRC